LPDINTVCLNAWCMLLEMQHMIEPNLLLKLFGDAIFVEFISSRTAS